MRSNNKLNSETLEAEVVVVGGGSAGLCAAIAAAKKGKNVILLEKAAKPGGNSAMAGGFFACGSPLQKRQNITITKDDLFRKAMEWHRWYRINPRILRAFLNQSGETIGWLEKKGVEFELSTGRPPGGLPIVHMPTNMMASVQKALIKSAKELGVNTIVRTMDKHMEPNIAP